VLIIPQRQTALAAKQAAALDVLSGGRLRLGVGVGWNWVEFQALGMSFKDRGKRIEEQIALLRELWTKPSVTFDGTWHHVDRAGLNPMPVQRPIPLWMGADREPAIRRAARLAEEWRRAQDDAAGAQELIAEDGDDQAAVEVAPAPKTPRKTAAKAPAAQKKPTTRKSTKKSGED